MKEKRKKQKIKKGKTKKYGITFWTYRKQRTENRKETEIETENRERNKKTYHYKK